MKKIVTCIAILTMMSAMVSCGRTETDGTDEKISISKTTTSAETTTETTTAAATTASKDEKKAENTTSAAVTDKVKANEKAETPVKEAEKEQLVLNENERLFGGYVDTNGDALNIRKEPFTTAEIIGSIPDKTQINVFSCGKADWYATSFNGKTGYISADYVKEIPSYDMSPAITDISVLAGQWKYQVAPEGMNIMAGVTDNGIIDISSDGTYIYTDLDGKKHSGTVKVEYDTLGGDYSVPFFAFYEGDEFFIGCYCHQNDSDVYITGNGGMSQIVRN
jgi:hypothetical protein